MLNIIVFIIGLIGAGLISFGAWLLSPAFGFITAGLLCIIWSYLISRMMAINLTTNENRDD